MKNQITILLLLVLSISLVSSATTISPINVDTLGTYVQNKPLDLIQLCSNATSLCDACLIANVKFPNSSILISNETMTKRPSDFNYTLDTTQTDTLGEYLVNGNCNSGNEVTIWTYKFRINKTGEELSTAQGLLYVIFLMASIFIFVLSLFYSISLPWQHVRDQEGKIISVNDYRYLKIFLSGITYVMLMFIFGVIYNVTDSFLFLTSASSFFYWLFRIMLSFLWPVIVFIFLITIMTFWENMRKKALIGRGLNPE